MAPPGTPGEEKTAGTERRRGRVSPVDRPRPYARDEIIVSKTDLRGHITYANDVFVRVSGFSEEELLGAPHSVVRHPDMPRAVFHLLWETIERGEEIFAFVKNLAADGCYYWVLAHVTPSFDSAGRIVGYHSHRRWPDPSAVAEIEPVYRTLLAEERRQSTGNAQVAAGRALLDKVLADAGVSYEEFVWGVINRGSATA
jgi:PAS domain S-box-containing protein